MCVCVCVAVYYNVIISALRMWFDLMSCVQGIYSGIVCVCVCALMHI